MNIFESVREGVIVDFFIVVENNEDQSQKEVFRNYKQELVTRWALTQQNLKFIRRRGCKQVCRYWPFIPK